VISMIIGEMSDDWLISHSFQSTHIIINNNNNNNNNNTPQQPQTSYRYFFAHGWCLGGSSKLQISSKVVERFWSCGVNYHPLALQQLTLWKKQTIFYT